MTLVEVVFWGSLALIAYVYVGYPLVLAAWSRLRPRPVRHADHEPTVTLVLAVRNGRGERESLEAKLVNLLDLDYPADRMQIVVSLDGDSPESERIAAR